MSYLKCLFWVESRCPTSDRTASIARMVVRSFSTHQSHTGGAHPCRHFAPYRVTCVTLDGNPLFSGATDPDFIDQAVFMHDEESLKL